MSMKKGIIYRYVFPNGKQYIGQTTKTIAARTAGHVSDAKLHPDIGCVKLNRAMIKYEFQFDREIVIEHNDPDIKSLKEELNSLEKHYIEKYDSINKGYNIDNECICCKSKWIEKI